MRTIYFNDEDIKEGKLALVNQKLTPLQSAFLMQYITNLEEQLQQKKDVINKAIHRIQLIQMDGEVTIRDLTELVNILKGVDKE